MIPASCRAVFVLLLLLAVSGARADVPVVTVLADFEDDTVAASIGDVRNILAADCSLSRTYLARGTQSLRLDIGATVPNASVTTDLVFRVASRFEQADRVAAYCWIKEGTYQLAFQLLDSKGQYFETVAQQVSLPNRWVRVVADVAPERLKRVDGTGKLSGPIQVVGFRVTTPSIGRQEFLIDDLQVEHEVPENEAVQAEFVFNHPTKMYRPGSSVGAAINLENRSRHNTYRVSVEATWVRPDGRIVEPQRDSINLNASGTDFRSRQAISFSRQLDEPGLYRLIAQVRLFPRDRASRPLPARTFETTIAVAPTNQGIARGRSTLFSVGSNLLREPVSDQMLEIDLASEVGVNALQIETPWNLVEPRQGSYRFGELDRIVDGVIGRDIEPILVLSDVPEWLARNPAGLDDARAAIFERLAQHYGSRVTYYQLSASILNETPPAAQAAILRRVESAVQRVRADARLISAPINLQPGQVGDPQLPPPDEREGLSWCFQTHGEVADALDARRRAVEDLGWTPSRTDWWMHRAEPRVGAGSAYDAEAVLRYYLRAARAGVAGLIWFDLRDDDNDPTNLEQMRGLVRRDLSPRTSLVGYASAAGMLTGARYAGPMLGTPETFDSGLFIRSDQQVGVLDARPNRVLPALISPIFIVPAELEVLDFERRLVPVQDFCGSDFVSASARPMFIKLALENSQPEPQLALVKSPWIRLPRTVFAGQEAGFQVTLEPPFAVRRGYVQVVLPDETPLRSSLGAQGFQTKQTEAASMDVKLIPTSDAFSGTTASVRCSIEGRSIEIPIDVVPHANLPVLKSGANVDTTPYQVGTLRAKGDARATASGAIFAALAGDELHVAITLEDDRLVPFSAKSDAASGDALYFGVAVENTDRHAEVRIDLGDPPELLELFKAHEVRTGDWKCTGDVNGKKRTVRLKIPAGALALAGFEPGGHVLLAVRYTDDDADGFPPTVVQWGKGLDGSRLTGGFRWLEIPRP